MYVGRSGNRSAPAAGEQLRGDLLRFLLDGGRAIGHQRRLAAQRFVDAGAQQRPVRLSNLEVAAEIEQGALAHGAAEAFGVHQAMGEVRLAVLGAPGLGAPNKHDARIAARTYPRNTKIKIMALHSVFPKPGPLESTSYKEQPPEIPPKCMK